MSFCKPANEIYEIDKSWAPKEMLDLYSDGHDLERMLLSVRNGQIYSFLCEDDVTEEKKDELLEIANQMRESLILHGFLRPDIIYLSSPESFFIRHYISELGFMDNDNVEYFLPYYLSNEDYESYQFYFERIESVLDLMHEYLDEKNFSIFQKNVMLLRNDVCDTIELDQVKNEIFEKRGEILPKLEKIFMMF